ncbi:Uncharacterized protein conserved in archaea [Gloeomargarita lithophora Alchichica-D10]|uniref:Uncharacterized protein conserved in archaea n=1 Tax=Gloeomargarita lithophora Alchichica-D10 TaxID=1188229 RepID=A0A1J0AAJ6_9CYAN|nr:putative CRISPR-associated protein [Gloeomargarita lithophora]APB32951.1 Uncharacterized protein conserved in archaea [Gloeomargarita lithophora Alchichica-D10]
MSHILIVSPCGTSTLTNQVDAEIRKLLNTTADAQEKDLAPEQKAILEPYIAQRRSEILQTDITSVRNWSAELNGILGYYNGQIPPKSDVHILLATATYQGQQTANIIQSWLEKQGCHVQIASSSQYLNVSNAENFRIAMNELVEWAENTLPGYRKSNYKIVFNLTGGFKSVNGFLQAMGMFYADECVYIFQNSSELIRIPRLPVKLDPEGIIGQNLMVFRLLGQMEKKHTLPVNQCQEIPETLLYQVGDEVELSEWGRLVWNRCKDDYYSEKLLPPLSEKIRYSEVFKRTFAALPADRKLIVNQRLDQLSHCLDTNQTHNPNSLDFKKLKHNPYPPSTHECDAWSDQDAKRIFGHFEDDIFVIDKLDKGLH